MRYLRCTVAVAIVTAATSAHAANILTDPGFELNPLLPGNGFVTLLNNFPTFQNQWGAENGAIVGVTQGITPSGGTQMLYLSSNLGGVASQAGQVVDISSYAAAIDAGLAVIAFGAQFNSAVPSAVGGVYIRYYTGNSLGTLFGPTPSQVLTFDNNPATWELAGSNAIIPATTRWIEFQVAYSIASILGVSGTPWEGGFVDDAYLDLRVIPEPSALGTLLLPALALRRRRTASA